MITRTLLALGLWAIVLTASAQESPAGPATQSVSQVSPPSATPVAVSADKLTDATEINRALSAGSARVIVMLSPPAALGRADFASRVSLAALRPEVSRRQQEVLDQIPANQIRVGHRFENIAGFSAEVSPDGLRALQAHPQVVSIEPVLTLYPHLAQGIALIHGMTYRSTYNGAGLAIAICDTGVDYNHPRLGGGGFPNSKVIGGFDFGDNDADPIPNTEAHGTCCAGIAAGDLGTVGDYIGGVAYNAKIYALKITSGTGGSASTADMVAAWDWCVTHKNDNPDFPIMVISTSFGGGQYFATCDTTSTAMTTAANNAVAAGITVLASSGNDGFCNALAWPSCITSVISVGAVYDASFGHFLPCVDGASCGPKISTTGCATGFYVDDVTAPDKVTAYANVASFLTVFAPADQCYTLDITGPSGYASGDYYSEFGGTSAACPYAAGAVACLQSAAKALTGSYLSPAEVRSRLTSLGDNVTDTKVAITKPRVNLQRLIESLGTNPVLSFASATLIGGNGNQSVDPNECTDLRIAVHNDGAGAATNVSATLISSTPGVSVVQGNSAYPNLAAGATGTNTASFQLSTSPSFICGTPVNLTIVLTYGGGTNSDPFSLASGGTNYVITQTTGAVIDPGTNDIGNHSSGTLTTISLPFSYAFYGQTYTNATIAPDGYVQFTGATSSSANNCLPVSGFTDSIFAFWDNLRTDGTVGATQGIYTSTNGVAPNRIFNIEWRASYSKVSRNGNPVNFEVRLYENAPRFDLVYGVLNGDGSSATVGCQKSSAGPSAQFECAVGGLSTGLQLAFQTPCVDGGGCGGPAIVADFSGSPTSGTAPLTVSFTNLSSGATSYHWDFGDGKTSVAANPQNTYANAGIYSVQLMAIGGGATNILTRTNYVVATSPPPPVVNFSAGPTNGTVPLAVSFTNLSSGATSYLWNFGDGQVSAATSPANNYTNAGSYTVSLTAIGAGGTNTLTRTNYVVATSPPPPVVNFSAGPTNGTVPLAVSFTNLSSGATSYLWNFGDGQVSAATNPANNYTNAGSYTVSLTAIGAGGTNTLTRTNYIVAITPAQLVVQPASLDFGLIAPGATTQAGLTVSNAGQATLTGTAMIPGGPFAILSGASFSLAESGTTNLQINFTPAFAGLFSNAVVFATTGGASTNALSGRAADEPVIVLLALNDSGFTFSFDTIPGLDYEVQYTDSLEDPVWQTLQSAVGDGLMQTITNSISETEQRFYRLKLQ